MAQGEIVYFKKYPLLYTRAHTHTHTHTHTKTDCCVPNLKYFWEEIRRIQLQTEERIKGR